MKNQLTKRLATLGIASICAVGALTGCATTKASVPTPPQVSTNSEAITAPQQTSPMGMRPMMTIDGNRYVFLNNGEAFKLEESQLGKEISKQNDGTLFELTNYAPAFRMAFESNGEFYICENVGKADDTPIDIKEYLQAANLQQHIMFTDIFDHMGGSILSMLEKEDSVKLLDALTHAKVATLETSDYEAIAKAQTEGLSYRVEFSLDDHTTFTSYIIPSMNYITIGDYTCVLEDLDDQIGSYFEGLEASESITYN